MFHLESYASICFFVPEFVKLCDHFWIQIKCATSNLLWGLNMGREKKKMTQAEKSVRQKRAKYEQEKHPERIFNNKWQEGQEWLVHHDDQSKIMKKIVQ